MLSATTKHERNLSRFSSTCPLHFDRDPNAIHIRRLIS
jgi:hypothetical protein